MKTLMTITVGCFAAASPMTAQNQFNIENVRAAQEDIADSLKSNPIAIGWKNETDNASKVTKFSDLLSDIAGPVTGREWMFPGGEWLVIEWTRVNQLGELLEDQKKMLEITNVAASNDQEMARICVIVEALVASSRKMDLWYENWLLDLAKSNKRNLKWLAFVTSSGIAEDFGREDGLAREVDWIKWEQAYNASDALGKSLLLVHMSEMAMIAQDHQKVSSIHLQVFAGSDDALKAVALYAGSPMFGEELVSKWRETEINSPNTKLRSLAQQALSEQ